MPGGARHTHPLAGIAVIRGGAGPQELEAAIRLAISGKPKGHDFHIERGSAPALTRHMSRTGG